MRLPSEGHSSITEPLSIDPDSPSSTLDPAPRFVSRRLAGRAFGVGESVRLRFRGDLDWEGADCELGPLEIEAAM